MLAHALVVGNRAERDLQLNFVRSTCGGEQRGGDPRLGYEPSRKVDSTDSLHRFPLLINGAPDLFNPKTILLAAFTRLTHLGEL